MGEREGRVLAEVGDGCIEDSLRVRQGRRGSKGRGQGRGIRGMNVCFGNGGKKEGCESETHRNVSLVLKVYASWTGDYDRGSFA